VRKLAVIMHRMWLEGTEFRFSDIEPDEHGSVRPTQMHSTGHALLQDVELMPQYQDFDFQSPSRSIAKHADKKEAELQACDHVLIRR
jgi:hypothetical protein